MQLQISLYSKGHQSCQSPMTSKLYLDPRIVIFIRHTHFLCNSLALYSNEIAQVQNYCQSFKKKKHKQWHHNSNGVLYSSEEVKNQLVSNLKYEFLDLDQKQYGMSMILNQHC